MIRCDATVDVDRPPDDVFAFIDDVTKTPRWVVRCAALELTSPPPKGVGATLRYTYKERSRTGVMDGVVTEHEPGRRLVMKFVDKNFEVALAFRLDRAGRGTRVEHAIEIWPRSLPAKLMTPFVRGVTQQQIERDLAQLKESLSDRG
jgi:uncharacterized protein YndB with AHSA1/START domain